MLETLLVIAVLVSLGVIIYPNFTGRRERARLESVASDVASVLLLARSTAMETGRQYRCVFEDSGAEMRVEYESDPLAAPGQFVRLKAGWARVDLFDEGVRCTMVDLVGYDRLLRSRVRDVLEQELPDEFYEPIVFYPDGRCDSARIVLVAGVEDQLQLQITGMTGQVTITREVAGEERAP